MKKSLYCLWSLIVASLPLLAEDSLKLELIAPDQPVVISQNQLDEFAKHGDAAKALMNGHAMDQGIQLKFRITNPSDQAITFLFDGDITSKTLSLKGPGAVNHPHQGVIAMGFSIGREVTIDAGSSKEFTIENLKHGKRDMDRWLIMKPGVYQIGLSIQVEIEGRKGRKELKSEPVKLQVVVK